MSDLQATDPDTTASATGDVTVTRFYTFAGATVATSTVTPGEATAWALMLGDIQGSAHVMMDLVPDAGETTGFEPATTAHTVTRNAYLPYGARRGTDQLTTDRGWLGQLEDNGTGLTYLNARYYDPILGRFLSPDPLMDPGDPRTLDPYRYADNNPVVFQDATGLCSGLSGQQLIDCGRATAKSGGVLAGAVRKANASIYAQGQSALSARAAARVKPVHAQIPESLRSGPLVNSNSIDVGGLQLQALQAQEWNPSSTATRQREAQFLAWGIANGGSVYNTGPMCGKYMVCIVGNLPTGTEGNAITLGRVVVFDAEDPNSWWQYHEYAHVKDQLAVGVDAFLADYGRETSFVTTLGFDSHDGNILERTASDRADLALELERNGGNPMALYNTNVYDAGYEAVGGKLADWLKLRGSNYVDPRYEPLVRGLGLTG